MRGLILFFVLGCLAFAGEPVQIACVAELRIKSHPPVAVVRLEMERCSDIKFKGGGVVVRQVIDSNTGKWAIRYFPSHEIEWATVSPKP